MFYFWVPIIFVYYCVFAYIDKQNNTQRGYWTLWLYLFSLIPSWPIISRFSKNLVFDGVLYDFVMMAGYLGFLLYLGAAKDFQKGQWFGLSLVVFGLMFMKIFEK